MEEGHQPEGDYIKSVVFGGLDGILTTFAIVAGSAGGSMPVSVILILGFSSKFADALAMGLGDALSSKAEHEHIFMERQREYWEYDSYPEGEIREMIDLYVAKGMSKSDAETVITLMSQHRDFFVDVMMVEELGLQVPDEEEMLTPWKDGLVTFTSFIFFGFFPLLTYCVFPFAFPSLNSSQLFVIASICSLLTLFLLGAVKSVFSTKSWFRSGVEMMIIGALVAAIAYGIGALTDAILLDYLDVRPETYSNLK